MENSTFCSVYMDKITGYYFSNNERREIAFIFIYNEIVYLLLKFKKKLIEFWNLWTHVVKSSVLMRSNRIGNCYRSLESRGKLNIALYYF